MTSPAGTNSVPNHQAGESGDPGAPVLRPAATVMLVRDNPNRDDDSQLEVLMVRRNLNSDFVGGAYVFPGGAVDPADSGPEAEQICVGRTDAEASAVLGLASGGLSYWVAVLRETFEEAGVLLAERAGAPILSLADPIDEERFGRHRHLVNTGQVRFLDVCAEEGLSLSVGAVHYFAHWITPLGAPRRYDTRFFVAAAPPEQIATHDAGETIADVWVAPTDALALHRQGEIDLIFPTIRNLQAISRFATSQALVQAAAAAADNVPVIEPRVLADGNGVRIVLPGDPGYDEATTATAPSDPASFSDAVRSISMAANTEPMPPSDSVDGASPS